MGLGVEGVELGWERRGTLEIFSFFTFISFACFFWSGMFGVINPIKIL